MTAATRPPLVFALACLATLALPACTGKEHASAPRAALGRGVALDRAAPSATSAARSDNPTATIDAGITPSAPSETADGGLPHDIPAYDLAVDRERRAREAKEELGTRTITTVVSDVFVVVGAPGWQGGAFAQSVSLMRNAMAGYLNNRFGKKPSEAISVYLFPEAKSYEAFCKKKYDGPCIAHYGFYQPSHRDMVMNIGLGLGTLTHEIVHPLVEADFPDAPTWINEGIASLFEAPVITKPGEIHGTKNWRHPRLKRALTNGADPNYARLDVLFGMQDAVFRGDNEDLHYAMARYVCQWLDERGKLWPFYQRWRDTIALDATGEKAFKDVVGMTPGEAHVSWSKWALAL